MRFAAFAIAALFAFTLSCAKEIKVGPEEAKTIAEEAYIYGTPIVDNYRVLYAYAVYKDSGAYKAPFNHLAIVMPDTTQPDSVAQAGLLTPPYALSWLDLRKEPVVITVSPMPEGQAFRVQLVDLYTHNFDEISPATVGHAGGNYMIVLGPYSGGTPPGIAKVFQCETVLALALIRPAPAEKLAATEKFLDGFNVQTLSEFEGKRPEKPDALIFPPYSRETAQGPGFFQYLNFALQFCPVHPSEIQERARFAKLGIAAGKSFNVATADPDMLKAINDGMASARAKIAAAVEQTPDSAATYGPRTDLKNDFLARAAAAKIRLYGPPLQ
jgi:hypothetical protein